MRIYLLSSDDRLEDAVRYDSKKWAVKAFKADAEELALYNQRHEASLHYANSKAELQEYPDFVLSLGPRGGVKCEKC